jgi:hypothetical protein
VRGRSFPLILRIILLLKRILSFKPSFDEAISGAVIVELDYVEVLAPGNYFEEERVG